MGNLGGKEGRGGEWGSAGEGGVTDRMEVGKMVGVPSRIWEHLSYFEVGNRGVAIIDFGISNLKSS